MIKNKLKVFSIFFLYSSLLIILLSSLINVYERKDKILNILGKINKTDNKNETETIHKNGHHYEKRFLVNPLKQSTRQIPPSNIKDLKINENSDIYGQWSAPVDWNVQAVHAILLPTGEVMTFGAFGVDKKEDKD